MRAGSRQKCLIYKFSQFPPIIPVVTKERLITFCLQRFSLLSLARQMAAPGTVLFGNRKGQTKAGTRPAGGTNSKTEEAPGFPNETYLSACDSKIVCVMPLRVPGMMYVEWRASYIPRIKVVLSFPTGKKEPDRCPCLSLLHWAFIKSYPENKLERTFAEMIRPSLNYLQRSI